MRRDLLLSKGEAGLCAEASFSLRKEAGLCAEASLLREKSWSMRRGLSPKVNPGIYASFLPLR